MDEVAVHPRVMERHPDLSEEDVLAAWEGCLRSRPRIDVDAVEYIAIGCDARGRLVEMVAREVGGGTWLIYHALTPPTRKALLELGMTRR